MISPSFAQTYRTYDNKTFRRPTFYKHVEHSTPVDISVPIHVSVPVPIPIPVPVPIPIPIPVSRRPSTPFPKRKKLIANAVDASANEIGANEIIKDAFDLHLINADEKDSMDSDSDLSEDEKAKPKAWKNYIKVTDSAVTDLASTYSSGTDSSGTDSSCTGSIEETIKKTYYCRKCFEKFKSKLLINVKKSKTTSV
jgi:hypothetical protein